MEIKKEIQLPSRVEALYDCDGDEDDELSFVIGEIIAVVGKLLQIYLIFFGDL